MTLRLTQDVIQDDRGVVVGWVGRFVSDRWLRSGQVKFSMTDGRCWLGWTNGE